MAQASGKWWLTGLKAHHGSLALQGNGIRDSAAAAQLLQQVNFNGLTPLGTNLISKASQLLPPLPCSINESPAAIIRVLLLYWNSPPPASRSAAPAAQTFLMMSTRIQGLHAAPAMRQPSSQMDVVGTQRPDTAFCLTSPLPTHAQC